MGYYKDLREHIRALEAHNKLVRIKREINKDTELHPLVRWQFRGLPEKDRKAFLFENVVDCRGKKYDIPVLVGSHAASAEVYAIGMNCEPAQIAEKWAQAQAHPIQPRIVDTGPVHEEVHIGERLLEHGGMDEFPVPISTPGFDNAPYLTAANWVSKDPDTGIRNVGNYRAMVKAPARLGAYSVFPQHMGMHWDKCKQKGIPLQAAIVLGPAPCVGFVAVAKLPYGVDEYAIAGGIAGESLQLVKCKTVDLEVPATAEIVLEGEIPTDVLERDAPFGEFTGHMGGARFGPFFSVKCITHRRKPIFNAFFCQFPPSESSKLRQIGLEASHYKFLRYDCNLPGVLEVAFHESGGSEQYCVIRMKKAHPSDPWQALNGVLAFYPAYRKMVIAVDEDIDPHDPDSVNWALSFRMQPNRDIRVVEGRIPDLDPSGTPNDDPHRRYPQPNGTSSLLIDATRKWAYTPVSLPRKEFMERARQIWEEEGLPPLQPRVPWHGYSLGLWTEEDRTEAELALSGQHYQTGEKLARQRQKA